VSANRRQRTENRSVNTNDALNLINFGDLADPGTTGWKTCAVKIKKA
jgi:hypothetical protein